MSTPHAQACCRPLAEALAGGVSPAGGLSLLLRAEAAGELFYRLTGGGQEATPSGANEPVLFCMFCGADLRAGQRATAPRCDATPDDGDDEMTLVASEPTLVSV